MRIKMPAPVSLSFVYRRHQSPSPTQVYCVATNRFVVYANRLHVSRFTNRKSAWRECAPWIIFRICRVFAAVPRALTYIPQQPLLAHRGSGGLGDLP